MALVRQVTQYSKLLYKSVVFLILILILSNLIKSNELRTSILKEVKTFNSKLALLTQTTEIIKQKKELEQAVLAFGATIAFTEEGDSSETYQGGY